MLFLRLSCWTWVRFQPHFVKAICFVTGFFVVVKTQLIKWWKKWVFFFVKANKKRAERKIKKNGCFCMPVKEEEICGPIEISIVNYWIFFRSLYWYFDEGESITISNFISNGTIVVSYPKRGNFFFFDIVPIV